MISTKGFKAYDIRGVVPSDVNEELAYALGRSLAFYLKAKTLVIGHDIRLSGPSLRDAAVRGMRDMGTHVIDLGQCGTEMIYFAVAHLKADGGMMITASHNPAEYNGMKLVRSESRPISGDTGLKDLAAMVTDPDFETKMHEVLLVYKQIEMQFDENGDLIVPDDYKLTITVSYDEKPGIQAISNTAPDLRPTPEHGEVYRDAEYKRLGTLSLLAGIDLLTGEAIPLVSETHKSSDFIEFLKILDKKYPSQDTIRIILDNHSAHTSKETRRFLDTMPKGRFKFVFTPKHGSWLNMIESFFSKMTRQMLRGIRVNTKQELEERIYKYFDEVNREPVVYHWKYKMDEISEEEAVSI